jgi:DNA repair exonuclease SbcCD ATPase subunit
VIHDPQALGHSGEKGEIVSIKLLTDAGIQASSEDIAAAFDEDFPVHVIKDASLTEQQELPAVSVEKLTYELSLTTKAKVELLRELTKANKDAEKMRHAHMDHTQKLERELEQLQRDLVKLQEDNEEKEQLREKSKEECDRKVKHQESTINKYKQKVKELERNIKDKTAADRKLQDNQQEVERLNQAIVQSKKKLKEDQERYSETEQRRSKEIAALNKQIEEESKRSRHAEVKIDMIRKKVKLANNSLIERPKSWRF